MTWQILQGDCIERMAEMEEASVDAVVCDPPYGIGFMGHEWDQPGVSMPEKRDGVPSGQRRASQPSPLVGAGHARDRQAEIRNGNAMYAGRYDLSRSANHAYQGWCEAWAREAFRVLKPGGHLLASCGTRTYHRLAAGVEDAGFEVRDSVMWIYASGFPKSLDIYKRLAGEARRVSRCWLRAPYGSTAAEQRTAALLETIADLELPVEEAEWEGWGTALKPSHEPIVVGRKPLIGTVEANVLEHGTGGINVGGCRVGTEGASRKIATEDRDGSVAAYGDGLNGGGGERDLPFGRWPANVVLSEEAAAELDEQTGELTSGFMAAGTEREGLGYQGGLGNRVRNDTHGDSGGASRFFYCAKTSRAERNAGLEGFEEKASLKLDPTSAMARDGRRGSGVAANHHPTVKPINLMRWLCRLVTPPGGLILDPFLSSGTTGCAAVLEGFDFIGIEREAEYMRIARARIAFWAEHEGREVDDVLGLLAASRRESSAHIDRGQISLEEAIAEAAA